MKNSRVDDDSELLKLVNLFSKHHVEVHVRPLLMNDPSFPFDKIHMILEFASFGSYSDIMRNVKPFYSAK